MKKILLQGLMLVVFFFGSWLLIDQVNWMNIFRVKEVTDETEQKLGKIFLDVFIKEEKIINDTEVEKVVGGITRSICSKNKIPISDIKVYVIEKDEVNAFALPGGQIVVFSGLIKEAKNAEAFSGVLAHEMAHLQLNHVMKKLLKEAGLSVLLSIATGTGGAEIAGKIAHMLSSSAFDRRLEKEADLAAVNYLMNAGIDPSSFADFLYSMAGKENELASYLVWTSTHPDSKERAKYILEKAKQSGNKYISPVSSDDWHKLQQHIDQ